MQGLINQNIDFSLLEIKTDSKSNISFLENKPAVEKSFQSFLNEASSKKIDSDLKNHEKNESRDSVSSILNKENQIVQKTEKNETPSEKISQSEEKSSGEKNLSEKSSDVKNQKLDLKNVSKEKKIALEIEEKVSDSNDKELNNVKKSYQKITELIKKSKSKNEIEIKKENEKLKFTDEENDEALSLQNAFFANEEEVLSLDKKSTLLIEDKEQNLDNDQIISLENEEINSAKQFNLDDEGKIKVFDLRSEKENLVQKEIEENTELKVTELNVTDEKTEITLDVKAQNLVNENVSSLNNQISASNGSNFEAMVSNQIHENIPDIVKAGNIVLKDKDVGSIKLILHPEALGSVKIDLQINEKNIIGKIIVQTEEALNAFKESAQNLRETFIESGFENAGFEFSFADSSSGSNEFRENNKNNESLSRRNFMYGSQILDEDFETEEIISNSSRNSVNIVA